MDLRGVLNLGQALRYTAGITPDLRGSTSPRYDFFQLRGFTVLPYLDGLIVPKPPIGFATPQTDTSRLERVEVLKGPASSLYGRSTPGGLVAQSSKLPTNGRSYGSLNGTGGNFDLYRIDADVGAYLTSDGSVRGRIYGTINGSHSQLARTGNRRFSISPAVTIQIDSHDTLTLLANLQVDPENSSYGSFPMVGSLYPAIYGRLQRNFYDGDQNFEKFARTQGAVTYIFNHRFDENWQISSRGRYDYVRSTYKGVYSTGTYVGPTTISRSAYGSNDKNNSFVSDTQLHGHFKAGPVRHTASLGFDYQLMHSTQLARAGRGPNLNVLSPDYASPITTPAIFAEYANYQQQIGFYGQEELQWRGLHITGSARNDWYDMRQKNLLSPSTTRIDQSQVTWRASGLYHFDVGFSPYISYSTSFQPQSGLISNDGGKTTHAPSPSLGKQLEGGLKYQIPETPILLSVAGFHLQQTNIVVTAGNLPWGTQSGLVHSDGFEAEGHINSWHNLQVDAAVGTQQVHDDSTGHPLIQSNKGSATLFAMYTLPSGQLSGLGLGAGIRYIMSGYGGQSAKTATNIQGVNVPGGSVTVPSYTLFDGSIRYELGSVSPRMRGWIIQGSIRNLFDRKFISSCFSFGTPSGWCWYGERRNAQGSIGFSW